MTTRTMNLSPDYIRSEGAAWGDTPPSLVFEEYENGEVVRRVRVSVNPVLIEELGMRLWEIRGKYAKALEDMTKALKGD